MSYSPLFFITLHHACTPEKISIQASLSNGSASSSEATAPIEHPSDGSSALWCEDPPNPDRDQSFEAILYRLEQQKCLHDDDITLADEFMSIRIKAPVYCDEVWRVLLTEQGEVIREPEMVLPYASVPDLLILDDGSHLLTYNHLQPQIFMEVLRNDPLRFWRQGLIGFGGVGLAIDRLDGNGFTEIEDLDLQLETLHQAVDPDLGWTSSGDLRLLWFGIITDDLVDGVTSPLQSPTPHKFYRTTLQSEWLFSPPALTVLSSAGSTGGVDPAVLSLDDGGEIMYLGPLDHYAMGWYSSDLQTWPIDPDVETTVPAVTPDIQPDPDGGYLMFYMKNGQLGKHKYQWSSDGFQWDGPEYVLYEETDSHNLTVDFNEDGHMWIYYNQLNPECLANSE